MTLVLNGTTGVSAVDGSASTPAIQGNDSNTGMFFPAADTIAFAEGGTEVVRIDSSGNVGIGVTPASFATVKALQLNTASTVMAFADELDIAQNVYYNAGNKYITNAAATLYAQSGGQHLWYRAASGTAGNAISFSENARIDSSGNLLVGTTSSDIAAVGLRLMNNNQAQFSKSGDWSLRMGRRDSTGIITEVYYNSSRVGDIATNGSNTTYNSASDYRLKENVRPMVDALTKVAALKPVTFTWKATGTNDEGFLAHELQAVVPQAVRGEKDEVDADGEPVYQSIDTSVLVATLTAAIQEQQTLITSLTARIAALEGAAS
jgi:hypothetical protein